MEKPDSSEKGRYLKLTVEDLRRVCSKFSGEDYNPRHTYFYKDHSRMFFGRIRPQESDKLCDYCNNSIGEDGGVEISMLKVMGIKPKSESIKSVDCESVKISIHHKHLQI